MELEQYKIYVMELDGTVSVFRPSSPVVLSEFVYSAQRMGTATLSATVRDVQCLDSLWTGREFVCLDESSLAGSGSAALAGSLEKFFLLHTPSSSKSNEDERYVHTLEFVSERDVVLSSVYFLDAVPTSSYVPDKYRSNQFSFSFYGTLSEFVLRFNSVLSLRGLSSRFSVVLDVSSIEVDGTGEYFSAGPTPDGYFAWTDYTGYFYSDSSTPTVGTALYVDEGNGKVISGDVVSAVTYPDSASEVKEVSFDKRTLFEALQDAFGVYGVPFWFLGDEIHFGEGSTVVPEVVFEYGHDEELLSISRNNTNARIVTRCTGTGGDTNIPYYYPNPTPKGTLGVGGTATGVTVADQLRFADRVGLGDTLTFFGEPNASGLSAATIDGSSASLPAVVGPFTAIADGYMITEGATYHIPYTLTLNVRISGGGWWLRVTPEFTDSASTTVIDWSYASPTVRKYTSTQIVRQMELDGIMMSVATAKIGNSDVPFHFGTEKIVSRGTDASGSTLAPKGIPTSWDFFFDGFQPGEYTLVITGYILSSGPPKAMYYPRYIQGTITTKFGVSTAFRTDGDTRTGWISDSGTRFADLSDAGLSMSGTPSVGDTITQTVEGKIPPQQNLMPPVYRSSLGENRWYNAINETYALPDGSGYYQFANEYNPLSPREYIQDFEDIYPTIRNLVDGSNNPLNVFDAVYFETGYNTHDVVGEEGTTRKYSYFFARLKPLGFNLFDCAIENGDMTVEMIDGHCAGCKFAVLVDDTDHNNVQVDGNGALVVGSDGRVAFGGPQDAQNDTTSNYVWICLQIDTTTYGDDDEGVMPGDVIRPAAGDPFVITNIALPQAYILAAEEKLKHEILKFMAENNAEKFTYSIKFSRIYLAHHHDVRDALNEHAALYLRYGAWRTTPGTQLAAPLHVQQYTVRQQEGEPLPEVDVELTDEIEDSPGGLNEAISASVENIVNVVYGGSVGSGLNTALGDARYLRRDKAETVAYPMTFQKGWQTDAYVSGVSGSALTVGADGKTSFEVDRLVVRDGTVLPGTTASGGGDSLFEIYEYDDTNHKYAVRLKEQAYHGSDLVDVDGLFSYGFMSAGGLNAAAGGGGGTSFTWEQLQESGTKIAVLTLNPGAQDEEVIDVYAPVGGSGGGGTVTRVGMEAQDHLRIVSGSPVTGAGTIKIGVASGYSVPSDTQIAAWTAKQDALSTTNKLAANCISGLATVATSGSYNDLSGTPTIPTVPTALKNPYALTITSSKSYDGSAAVTLEGADIATVLGFTPFNPANIEQSTGSSTAKVMSQKAVTDALALKQAVIDANNKLDYAYISNTPTIPTKVSDLQNDAGYTTNTGTVTGVKMNGGTAIQPTNGVVDLGTVITSLSGYLTVSVADSTYQSKVSALGSTTRPVYISGTGTFSRANTYAGGTKVTLNGTDKGSTTASFYAPTGYGTSGQYLVSRGSGSAPTWASAGSVAQNETALVTGGTVYSALQNYARNNAVVHLDGDETIDGDKTFIGGVEVVGWDSLLSTMEGETLADALAAKADNSELADYLPLTDFRFDILCKSVLGSDADLNKVYDTSYSDLTGHFRYYAYVGANPWPSVPGTQTTAGVHGFPTTSNANALLTIDTYSESDSLHLYQMGFSGDGNIYFRKGAAAKENGSWIDPWSNGNWNRLLWEDHNGDAAVTRDLSVSRQLNVAGDVVLPQSGGFWFDTAKSYISSAYFVRGDAAENDYSFYLHTGTDGNGNPAAMFIECGALYVNGGDILLQKGHAVSLDAGVDAYIRRGGASTDYSLYICAGHGSDGTSKVNTHVFTAALCPNATADQSDLGTSNFVWNNLYAKRWYPDPANAPDAYIEWDATNQAFKINGPVYSTGQVSAGGIFSNS